MNKIKLVQSLVEMANELPNININGEKFDALRRPAEMIIRKVFGVSSKYLEDLNNIHLKFLKFQKGYYNVEEYRSSGGLTVKIELRNLFNTMLEELKLFGISQEADKVQQADVKFSNRIFIVHGHDETMKHSVARTVEKLGFEPIILHEKPNNGRTIIEKFTDYSDVSFAIVLLSPDDVAFKRASTKRRKIKSSSECCF